MEFNPIPNLIDTTTRREILARVRATEPDGSVRLFFLGLWKHYMKPNIQIIMFLIFGCMLLYIRYRVVKYNRESERKDKELYSFDFVDS